MSLSIAYRCDRAGCPSITVRPQTFYLPEPEYGQDLPPGWAYVTVDVGMEGDSVDDSICHLCPKCAAQQLGPVVPDLFHDQADEDAGES